MDRIALVVVQEIPDKPDGPPFEWYTSPTGNIVIHKVPAGESEFQGEWRFSPQTLNTLDALYKEFQNKPIVDELQTAGKQERVSWRLWLRSQVPTSLQKPFLALEQWQWMALCVLVIVGYGLQRSVTTIFPIAFGVVARKSVLALDRDARRRAFRPFGFVAMAALCVHGAPPAGSTGDLASGADAGLQVHLLGGSDLAGIRLGRRGGRIHHVPPGCAPDGD